MDNTISRTLSYARHLGRELALLSLSALGQPGVDLETVEMADVLQRAVRVLTQEAEEYLSTSGKALEASFSALEGLDLETLAEEPNARDLSQMRKKLAKQVQEARSHIIEEIEKVAQAVNLVGEALHLPLLRNLSDNPDVHKFTLKLLECYREHHTEIDRVINEVSSDWSVDRMNSLDRDTVRLGALEMLFDPVAEDPRVDATPIPVIINEAVELAKKYGTEESFRFVNGVLRNVMPHAEERRRRA